MSKKRASVSIMALFIFAVMAFLALFLFSRIEHRTVLEDTRRDAIQSGYDAESLLYLAWEDVEPEEFAKLMTYGGTRERPKPSFRGVTADHSTLSTERRDGAYSGFVLNVASTYRGIRATAILKGNLVDPVFDVENGILNLEENSAHREAVAPWIRGLSEDFSGYGNGSDASWTCEEGELTYRAGDYLLREEGRADQSFRAQLPARGCVAKKLTLKTPLDMKGLVVFEDGATIEGVIRIEGVCLAKGEVDIDGDVICRGLYIGKPNDAVRVHADPRATEKVLARFPGFVSPNAIRVKKVYSD
ncbi:MAG: hypothetical protein SPI65_01895 [Peptoniphilus sp.]|nr:hypothetical protein [Peptoniphilus sp.]MDD7363849.1 hypothetical protein [Bacillota bacterium]MDY6044312.1 hypothetical protein [Peptoniphilus sp.]